MGWWQVNADTLAGSRFVVSPLAETFASLKMLHAGDGHAPGRAGLADAHLPAYRGGWPRDPVTALLIRAGLGRSGSPTSSRPHRARTSRFADEIARVRETPPSRPRPPRPLPAAARCPPPCTATTCPTVRPTSGVRVGGDRTAVLGAASAGAGGRCRRADRAVEAGRLGGRAGRDAAGDAVARREPAAGQRARIPAARDLRGAAGLRAGHAAAGGGWRGRSGSGTPSSTRVRAPSPSGPRAVPERPGPCSGPRGRVLVLLDSPMSTTQLWR